MKDFLVLDDVLSATYLKQIVDNIFDYNWKFSSNLTHGDYENVINCHRLEYGFSAILTESQKYFMLPLIYKICDLSNIKITNERQIYRIVPRLQTMLSLNNDINDAHIDFEEDHYVIIFYPHNIDGETILYKETSLDIRFSKFINLSSEERKSLIKNFTILEKIQPKENRALVFNGNRYHASSSPKFGPRCIININIGKFEGQNKKILNYG